MVVMVRKYKQETDAKAIRIKARPFRKDSRLIVRYPPKSGTARRDSGSEEKFTMIAIVLTIRNIRGILISLK